MRLLPERLPFDILGAPVAPGAPASLRAEGAPLTTKQAAEAAEAYTRFEMLARVSRVPNPVAGGVLSDGSTYRITTLGNSRIMQVWPKVENDAAKPDNNCIDLIPAKRPGAELPMPPAPNEREPRARGYMDLEYKWYVTVEYRRTEGGVESYHVTSGRIEQKATLYAAVEPRDGAPWHTGMRIGQMSLDGAAVQTYIGYDQPGPYIVASKGDTLISGFDFNYRIANDPSIAFSISSTGQKVPNAAGTFMTWALNVVGLGASDGFYSTYPIDRSDSTYDAAIFSTEMPPEIHQYPKMPLDSYGVTVTHDGLSPQIRAYNENAAAIEQARRDAYDAIAMPTIRANNLRAELLPLFAWLDAEYQRLLALGKEGCPYRKTYEQTRQDYLVMYAKYEAALAEVP